MPVTRSDIPNLAIHPSFCGLISTVIFPCPSLPSSCSSKSQKKIMLSVALSLIFSATLTKIIWVWHLTGALRWGSEKDLFERGEKKKKERLLMSLTKLHDRWTFPLPWKRMLFLFSPVSWLEMDLAVLLSPDFYTFIHGYSYSAPFTSVTCNLHTMKTS